MKFEKALDHLGQLLIRILQSTRYWNSFNAWLGENFGVMAERSVNLSHQSVKKMAGQLRRDAELVKLRNFELRAVRETTVARADAVAWLFPGPCCAITQPLLRLPGYRTRNSATKRTR